MKLSTKGRYGLRAMVDLAFYSINEPVSIQSIAQRQKLSDSYLEQLFGKLRKAGLIASVRGAQGGYILAKKADEISVGDILRALEGDLTPVECTEITGERSCDSSDSCVTKYVWKKINDSISNTVDAILLSELVNNMSDCRVDENSNRDCDK